MNHHSPHEHHGTDDLSHPEGATSVALVLAFLASAGLEIQREFDPQEITQREVRSAQVETRTGARALINGEQIAGEPKPASAQRE